MATGAARLPVRPIRCNAFLAPSIFVNRPAIAVRLIVKRCPAKPVADLLCCPFSGVGATPEEVIITWNGLALVVVDPCVVDVKLRHIMLFSALCHITQRVGHELRIRLLVGCWLLGPKLGNPLALCATKRSLTRFRRLRGVFV